MDTQTILDSRLEQILGDKDKEIAKLQSVSPPEDPSPAEALATATSHKAQASAYMASATQSITLAASLYKKAAEAETLARSTEMASQIAFSMATHDLEVASAELRDAALADAAAATATAPHPPPYINPVEHAQGFEAIISHIGAINALIEHPETSPLLAAVHQQELAALQPGAPQPSLDEWLTNYKHTPVFAVVTQLLGGFSKNPDIAALTSSAQRSRLSSPGTRDNTPTPSRSSSPMRVDYDNTDDEDLHITYVSSSASSLSETDEQRTARLQREVHLTNAAKAVSDAATARLAETEAAALKARARMPHTDELAPATARARTDDAMPGASAMDAAQ